MDALILVDRKIDPISVFLTGQTYEALIDEYYNIEFSGIKINKKIVYPEKNLNEE